VNRKFKLLGTFLIMALLVSLVSIVPLTAATAGTVTLEGGAVNQTIRWLSATDDLAASQPVDHSNVAVASNHANQILTIKVQDTDKNILTELPGTCSDNALAIQNFKCELLANPSPGPNGAFTTGHGSLEDGNLDDIPDNLLIRGLQQNASGWITAGTSAATGTVVLTAGLTAGAYQTLEPVGTIGATTGPNVPPTALSNKAQVQAVISAIVGAPTLGAGGLSIIGTSIDPVTMATTAGDTEILVPAGAVVAGPYVSTKFWTSITSWSAVVASAGGNTFDYKLEENYTVAARYKYNSIDSITGRTTVSSSAHALTVDVNLREAAVDANGNVTRDAKGNLIPSAGSGIFAADVVLTQNTADHGKSGGKVYEDTKALAAALIRGQRIAAGTSSIAGLANVTTGVSILTDTVGGAFVTAGVVVGDVVFNVTDGSSGVITAVTGNTATAVLTGGGKGGRTAGLGLNEWLVGDTYSIGDGRVRVYGDNGALVNVSYKDEDPIATISSTARVDLTPPIIELIGPADKSYSNVQGQTFVVKVTDPTVAENAAAGLNAAQINNMCVDGTLSADLTPLLVGTNSLQVSYSLTITAQGGHNWWIPVRDQVGNFPKFVNTAAAPDNNAVPGAGDPAQIVVAGGTAGQAAPGNPFTVTIDTAAGTLASSVTGGRLAATADVTAGPPAIALGDLIADNTKRKAVTVTYALGAGDAPINSASVSASDFRIAGVTPASVSVANASGAAGAKTQSIVVEMGAEQATNAKPLVEIVGSITDKAGNTSLLITGTSATNATDKLAPVMTVTITGQAASIPVSNAKVTVAASATESANLTGTVSFLKVAADGTLEEDATKQKTISFSSTGTNQWEAKVDITAATGGAGANTPGGMNVRVTAQDDLSNIGTSGKADPDGTIAGGGTAGKWVTGALVYEFDNLLNNGVAMPGLAAPAANTSGFSISPNISTTPITTPKADVPNPFVRVDFEAEALEYPVGAVVVDSHKGVTLTSATLLKPGATVADDVLAQLVKIDDNSFVFAGIDLPLGTYKLAVKAKDEVGNISTTAAGTTATEFTYTFEVVEKALYKLNVIPGLNLVSIPMDPVSAAIDDVFGSATPIDLAVSYDPGATSGPWLIAQRNATTGLFEGTLTDVDAMHGYWVRSSSYTTASLDLPRLQYQQMVPVIPVVKGWNLVPVVDLAQGGVATAFPVTAGTYFANLVSAGNPTWTVAYTFNTVANAWVRVVAATPVNVGTAYWVWVSQAGTIIP